MTSASTAANTAELVRIFEATVVKQAAACRKRIDSAYECTPMDGDSVMGDCMVELEMGFERLAEKQHMTPAALRDALGLGDWASGMDAEFKNKGLLSIAGFIEKINKREVAVIQGDVVYSERPFSGTHRRRSASSLSWPEFPPYLQAKFDAAGLIEKGDNKVEWRDEDEKSASELDSDEEDERGIYDSLLRLREEAEAALKRRDAKRAKLE